MSTPSATPSCILCGHNLPAAGQECPACHASAAWQDAIAASEFAQARFQLPLPCGTRRDYEVTIEDVAQILDHTTLSFYVGGERPFLRQRLASAVKGPESPADVLWRGTFKLRAPVEIRRIEKFWVELAWAEQKPQFKLICPDADVRPRIPIAIYLVP